MEVWQHDASSTHPEWTQQLVNNAMNMVQWQNVEDDIVTGPRPLGNQTLDLEDEGGDRKKRKPQKLKGIYELWSNDTFDCCLPGTEENVLIHSHFLEIQIHCPLFHFMQFSTLLKTSREGQFYLNIQENHH